MKKKTTTKKTNKKMTKKTTQQKVSKVQQPKPKKEKESTRSPLNLKGTVAQKLQQVADWNAIGVEFAATCKEILQQAKLTKNQLTTKVIREAIRIDQRKGEALEEKVWKLEGTWNRKRSPEQETTIKVEEEQKAKVEEEQKTNSNPSAQPQLQLRKRGPKGQTNKDRIYQHWMEDKKTKPEELLKTTEATVQLSTVRNWMRMWKKGEGLPSSAKKV